MSTGLYAVCDECRKRIFVGGRSGVSFYFAAGPNDKGGQRAAAMWVFDHAVHGSSGVRIIREESEEQVEDYEYVRFADDDEPASPDPVAYAKQSLRDSPSCTCATPVSFADSLCPGGVRCRGCGRPIR